MWRGDRGLQGVCEAYEYGEGGRGDKVCVMCVDREEVEGIRCV